ncbi:histidinol-phosphate transaminase [Oceanobacillus sp. CAU 1775]
MNKFWTSAVKRSDPYVPGEQLNQKNIIKLNTNENPYPPSPNVTDAIKAEVDQHLNLYPSPTADKLREDIGTYYGLSEENVFVGNGSDEVLAFSFMAFFEPGRVIRFPEISYSFYPVYAKLFDIPYETMELRNDFTIRPEDYFQSEGGVIFPNPNAPTSLYLELEAIRAILENNSDLVVIVDEAYIDFAEESAVSLLSEYPNLLIIQTLSKSRSLAGLRVGFALGSPDLIEALIRIKDSINSYTIDRLALAGASAAILDVDYFKETTEKVITTRKWVVEELNKRSFEVLPSQTNFLLIRHENVAAEELYLELKNRNILTRHFKQPKISDFLRVTIGTDEEMELFLEVLDSVL